MQGFQLGFELPAWDWDQNLMGWVRERVCSVWGNSEA